MLRKLD
jgi:hypothetical protein